MAGKDRGRELEWGRLREVVPYVIYVFDLHTGETSYVSNHIGEALGYSAAELETIGQNVVASLAHPDDLARLPALLARWESVRDDEVIETEHRMRHRDGSYRWMLGRDKVLARDERGRVRTILGTSIDVTERRAMEERLAQTRALESTGRMVGSIAHDFNNLLTSVLSAIEMAQGASDSVVRAEMLSTAQTGAERAAELTRSLLEYARGGATREAGSVQVAPHQQRDHGLQRGQVRPEVSLHIRSQPLTLAMAPAALTQIITNLAKNASDAMPGGGRLTIDVAAAGRWCELVVEDQGTGMSREVRARALDPFFTTKPGIGSGLGLATVAAIAARHGGHIELHSEPGAGTRVVVSLPLEAPAAQSRDAG